MGNAFNLGRLFGIQFRIHYTWFIIFVLITVSLSWQLFPDLYPDWPLFLYWVVGIVTSLLFFSSVVAHELSHSLVGRANGIKIKSITLFIFGGAAHMAGEATRPGAEFKMAIAGPACSLTIAVISALIWFLTRSIIEPVAAMFQWLALVNVILAAFNLIPGFPLDGGRVFRSFLWRLTSNYMHSTKVASWTGRGVGYLLILGGVLIMFIMRDWLSGLWFAFIGWFLENAASTSYRQAKWREAMHGFIASQAMTTDYFVVPADTSVNQFVYGYIFTSGRDYFLVTDNDELTGVLTLKNVKDAPRQNWAETRVKEIMTQLDRLVVAHPDQDALSILEQMDEEDITRMPVVSDGRIMGVVSRENLLRFLRFRSALGM